MFGSWPMPQRIVAVAVDRLDVGDRLGVGTAADRVLGVVDDVELLTEVGDDRADEGLDRPVALAHDRGWRAVDLELGGDPGAAGGLARLGVQLVAAEPVPRLDAAGTRSRTRPTSSPG